MNTASTDRAPLAQLGGPRRVHRVDEEEPQLGLVARVAVVVERAERMQRRVAAAGKAGSGLPEEDLRPIRRQHAHAVTAAQSPLNQQRRQPGDAILDLAVGHLEAVLGERHTVRAAAQGGQHQVAERGGVVQSSQSILPGAVPFAEG